jgi:hypothetical protein
MTKHFGKASKLAALGFAVAAAVVMPLSASAHGRGHGEGWGYGGGWHHGGDWDHDGGWHHHGGYWSGGRWIADALVTGAVVGLVSDALRPEPAYYGPPVVYSQPRSVYYEDEPVVRRRVVTHEVIYEDPYRTRYYSRDDDDD